MRAPAVCIIAVLGQIFFASLVRAQQPPSSDSDSLTAFCDFDDNSEISVRYNGAASKEEPHNGKAWQPGGQPATLFVGTPVSLNNAPIAVGAYSLYFIPNRKEWTMVVNKNVTPGAAYDQAQDVARSPMELGEVESPLKQVKISFAHVGPKECNIRLYYGKVGAFASFMQK